MFDQYLTLTLDGITAADYLTWVADPEPPALGHTLESVAVEADPLGTTVRVALEWNVAPPIIHSAAVLAGFPLTADVARVEWTWPEVPALVGTC